MKALKTLFSTLIFLILGATYLHAATLDDVRKKGFVSCGVSTGLPGFSSVNSKGIWQGLDVDVCRAVAAATLGDAKKVKYVGLTAKERFTALQSGEIDILSRNTTWTYTRDTSLGLLFAGVNFYDGQGFLVKKSLNVKNAKGLNGATFCVQAGTTTEQNVADFFRVNQMKYKLIPVDSSAQSRGGFESGRCDVLTSDRSQLAALRSTLKNPSSAVVLPDIISKEPLGPVVRKNDSQWLNIVKWSLNAMINAEELGISSKNVSQPSNDPAINRLLNRGTNFNTFLGLSEHWTRDIISQVGNYGEIFENNVGVNTPINLSRGANALWNQGGILYAPPFR